jgi:hypothetical protein
MKQVFVAPGPDSEPLTETELPWLAGRCLTFPAAQWRLILAEARLLDEQQAAALERCSGDFSYDSDPESTPAEAELTTLIGFLAEVGAHLAKRGAFAAEPPEDLEFFYHHDDYIGIVDLVRRVFEESKRRGRPFRAWVDV